MSKNVKISNPMKVITSVDTRWSYANVWEPKSINGGTPKLLFGKLSAPTFFTLNAPVFQMVWINIQNFCICLRSLFKVSIV